MMIVMKYRELGWLLAIIVIFQSFWLGLRINQLIGRKKEAAVVREKDQQAVKAVLAEVPEPKIEENLPQGGRLWLELKAETADQLELEVWAQADRPVSRADIRLFYPVGSLKVVVDHWQAEEGFGAAFWSGQPASPSDSSSAFLVTAVSFQILKPGPAGIVFDFSRESQLDCNLISAEGKDILEEVENVQLLLE